MEETTGVSIVQDPGIFLAIQVDTLTYCERGKTVNAVSAVSAVGVYVPPFWIYPKQRLLF